MRICTQIADGKGLSKASQSFEVGFSFFAAIFIGPGKYSLDSLFGLEDDGKLRLPQGLSKTGCG